MPNTAYLYEEEQRLKALRKCWAVNYKCPTEKNLQTKTRDRYIPRSNQYQRRQIKVQVAACIIKVNPIELKFRHLLDEWRQQSIFMSSMTEIVMLRPYLEIIAMGPQVVPYILNELKSKPVHLFWALELITGVNPILPEDEGRLDKMADAWINWGRNNGIIR